MLYKISILRISSISCLSQRSAIFKKRYILYARVEFRSSLAEKNIAYGVSLRFNAHWAAVRYVVFTFALRQRCVTCVQRPKGLSFGAIVGMCVKSIAPIH